LHYNSRRDTTDTDLIAFGGNEAIKFPSRAKKPLAMTSVPVIIALTVTRTERV